MSRHEEQPNSSEVTIASGDETSAMSGALTPLARASLPRTARNITILESHQQRNDSRPEANYLIEKAISIHCPVAEIRLTHVPKLRAQLSGMSGSANWAIVDMEQHNAFPSVKVPRPLVQTEGLCLITDIPGEHSTHGLRPMETLALVTHPRYSLPLRIGSAHKSRSADLAAALRPRLIILSRSFQSLQLVLATTDMIVAELCWLALARRASDDDAPGVWEDPVVQRATELDLGVRLPSQIVLNLIPPPVEKASVLTPLLDQLRRQLGLLANGEGSPAAHPPCPLDRSSRRGDSMDVDAELRD